MTGIVFTTEEEALPFLQSYERGRFDGLQEGETYHDDDVLVSLTGVGKIKATLRTERLLQTYKPRRLIHVGTCTALNDELAVGTLVAASQVFEGDRIELAAPTYPRMPLDPFFEDPGSGHTGYARLPGPRRRGTQLLAAHRRHERHDGLPRGLCGGHLWLTVPYRQGCCQSPSCRGPGVSENPDPVVPDTQRIPFIPPRAAYPDGLDRDGRPSCRRLLIAPKP